MMQIKKRLIFCLVPSLLSFMTAADSFAERKLEMWVHPFLPATEIIRKFSPLAAYLGENTGNTVKVKVSKSYKAHIERVGEGRMDLAYLGPAPYVKVVHNYGRQVLLACLEVQGRPSFHGVIIARKDSAIRKIPDLMDGSFAFGDPNSTMSHFLPRYMLKEQGIPVDELGRYEFLGSHHNVVLGVLGGYYDAGGVKEAIYYKYKDRSLKVLAQSPPIAEHLFVANRNLPEDTVDILRQLLLGLRDKKILGSIKRSVTGMVPVKDQDYGLLRDILRQFDKLDPE